MSKNPLTKENILNVLSIIYDKSKSGIQHVSPPVEKVADEYLKKYPDKEIAAKRMLNMQVAKCTTSGFINGFGGFIAMPVTIPANLSSVLYVQMRMIACAAYIGGCDLNDDEVQTFVYACLAGVSVNEIVKKFGVQLGEKLVLQGVKKIPGKVLTKINQRIGFRLITKFGEKGLINIGKMIPVVGAVINGGLDLAETKIIANRAYKMFILNDYSVGSDVPVDDVIDVDVISEDKNDVVENNEEETE